MLKRTAAVLVFASVLAAVAMAAPEEYGRYNDQTSRWERVGGELLHGFYNMYNLDIVHTPEDGAYPYKGWFFGWTEEVCNPGYPGCDAIFAARAPKLAGPWEVYCGEAEGKAVWDKTMSPAKWRPVIAGGPDYFNNHHNGDPSVVRHQGKFYMAYSATGHNTDGIPYGSEGDADSDISCVMGAVSEDGLHWTLAEAPLLVDPRNIGGAPVEPGNYAHRTGMYHRPGLIRENGVWKIWFDGILWGKPLLMMYAENKGAFLDAEDWRIVRGLENPCIEEFPNPDVVKVEDVYFAYSDAGGHPEEGWARRKTTEAASLNGRDWMLLGYMEADSDVQANHVPEAFVWEEDGATYIYVTYGGQIPGDYRYDRIRMRRKEISPEELARLRDALKEVEGPATFEERKEDK